MQSFTAVVRPETYQLIRTGTVNLIVALGGGWSQSKMPDAVAESRAAVSMANLANNTGTKGWERSPLGTRYDAFSEPEREPLPARA